MLTYPLIVCRHRAPSGCSTISIEFTIDGGPGLDSRWIVFIVQGKPPEPEGIVKVVAKTRREALQAANNLLKQGMVIVTVIGDGRVYAMEEFALTVVDERD